MEGKRSFEDDTINDTNSTFDNPFLGIPPPTYHSLRNTFLGMLVFEPVLIIENIRYVDFNLRKIEIAHKAVVPTLICL